MTVDAGSIVLETIAPPASVDLASVFVSTASVAVGSATVDVGNIIVSTKPVTAVATVDAASVYFSMFGDTSSTERWVAWNGALIPVLENGVAWHGSIIF